MIISPNDCKQYQTFTLDNGLRVIIIEDENAQKSAASLTVNCGHFDDPIERQGMAHFLEHMLFLGTQSFPDAGEYHQFINGHGGSNNAWTGTEFTNYFFDINSEFLPEALSRFSQFFSEPLLDQAYIEKERQAVDAEYKLKLKEDTHRIYQVHKETINPAHPFSKFSVGNIDTLADRDGTSIRQELVEFYHTYYVAKHMSLVVLGAMPLNKLRTLVEQTFDNLPDREGPSREITVPIYTNADKHLEVFIKPHKSSHKLVVSFALPCTDKYYVNKTINYIAHLIGHEGPGSILSLLKHKGWCNSLNAGRGVSGSNFKDFNVSFDLSDEGLNHCDEIIDILYQYIALFKQTPNHQNLYADKKKLLQLAFDYQEKTKAINLVSHLSVNMFHYEQQHFVYGDYIMEQFDPEEFDQILKLLSPNNMRLIHINPNIKPSKQAKWYHTPYHVATIDPSRLKRFNEQTKIHPQLKLPEQNPYLIDDIVMEPRSNTDNKLTPQIIHESEAYNFWFMQDNQFNVPKGHCYIAIDCPVSTQCVRNIAITRLFTELLLDSVIEEHYAAELAGLNYHIYVHQGGLTVHTSGISTNQPLLIEKLLLDLLNIDFTPSRFDQLKYQLVTHWYNSSKSKPVSQLFSTLTSTLQPNNPTMEQMANALSEVTFAQFNEVKQALFNQIHIDAFAYGNWTKAQAMTLTANIKQLILDNTRPHPEVFRPVLSLRGQNDVLLTKSIQHHDNAIVIYYQGTDISAETSALFIMLNHVMGPEFFHQLRTEKQLGYLVGTGYVPLNRYPGMAVYIQSPNNEVEALHQQITQFYRAFCAEILEVDDEQWMKILQSLVIQVVEKDRNLRILSQRFWGCIGNKDNSFNEREQIAECIINTSQNDLYKFAQKTLLQYSDSKLVMTTATGKQGIPGLNLVESVEFAANLKPLNKG